MKHLLLCVLLMPLPASAKTWLVGPTRQYKAPSAVASLVSNGDTVLVDSGQYPGDVSVWNASNLVLRCPDGMARFDANGNIAQQKGIFVIYGDNDYMEGFELYGAQISEANGDNGAGIRMQGHGFTARRCYIHDNQDGILTGIGSDTTGNILIEACEFYHNGVESGQAAGDEHNIYIGHCSSLTVRFCYFHGSVQGHELKTRANRNYIMYNKIVDGLTGDGSFSIDIPNGGLSYVIGNAIQKGPLNVNHTVTIDYGGEGIINGDSEFYFANNTVVIDRAGTTLFHLQPGAQALIANNIFAGSIIGFANANAPTPDTLANVESTDTSFFRFVDGMNYNYHLTQLFPGLMGATTLGSVSGISLTPTREYVDPEDSVSRQFLEEVGAFTKDFGSSVSESVAIAVDFPPLSCPGEVDTASIIIKNTGNVPSAYEASLFGPNAADFKVVTQNPSSAILPNANDTVRVVFSVSEDGLVTGYLSIMGGMGDTVLLKALGGTATLQGSGSASPTALDSSTTFPVTICNSGTCAWTSGVPVVTSPFSYVSGDSISIQPGECDTLIFAFNPTKSGTWSEMVTFPHSAGSAFPVNIKLNGTAISAGVARGEYGDAHVANQNYPNPFRTESVIPLTDGNSCMLELFNVCGTQEKVSYWQNKNGIVIERGTLPAGIYFYRIVQPSRGTIAEGSLVIRN